MTTDRTRDMTAEQIAQAMHDTLRERALAAFEKTERERTVRIPHLAAALPQRLAAERELWAASKPADSLRRLADAIAARDPLPLVGAWAREGRSLFGFEASSRTFERLTGVRLQRLNAAQRARVIFDWAGWSEDQVRQAVDSAREARQRRQEERDAEEQARRAARIMELAKTHPVRVRGASDTMSVAEFIDTRIADGFKRIETRKVGAIKKTVLASDRGYYSLPVGIVRDYAELAVQRLGA